MSSVLPDPEAIKALADNPDHGLERAVLYATTPRPIPPVEQRIPLCTENHFVAPA